MGSEMCIRDRTNLEAGRPATGPKAALITGIVFKLVATALNLDFEKTGSPPYPFFSFEGPATDPPPPS